MPTLTVLDINYTLDSSGYPIIQLFGANEDNRRVIYRVHGFLPYFYARTDDPNHLIGEVKNLVLKSEIVPKYLPIGYQTEKTPLVKITVQNPTYVRDLRDEVKTINGVREVFETDILFKNRFIIDTGIGGMSCLGLPNNTRDIHLDDIKILPSGGSYPFRSMSLDIECLLNGTGIPTPDTSPIILISLAFDPPFRNQKSLVLVAKHMQCNRDDVVICGNEAGVLSRLVGIIKEFDPDIITGYNSNLFDIPFISERAKKWGVSLDIGRDGSTLNISDLPNGNIIRVSGRVIMDLLPIVRKNYNLKRYNLDTVASELIHKSKKELNISDIPKLWTSNGQDLDKLISYARQDARITLDLLLDIGMLEKYVELSKLTGVLLSDIINGDQSSMIETLIMRKFHDNDRVVSPKPQEGEIEEIDLKGATILEPVRGLIDNMVVLDFKSLYPTIMISHNLCYTTILPDKNDIPLEDTIITVTGSKFVSPKIFKGLVPAILHDLLDVRIRLKSQMKSATEHDAELIDAKQYALKILLNSIYGYSGYRRSRLFCGEIASSVTGTGRYNLEMTKRKIEEMSPIDGMELKVVYGDTDSVFVQIIPPNKDQISYEMASSIGKIIAQRITESLPDPMELVFEGFARRGIFLTKKRYALLLENSDSTTKMKIRGLEIVRRDWCDLVSDTLKSCLDYILVRGDPEGAANYVRSVVNRVRNLETPTESDLNPLILSRKYTKSIGEYKNKQPHVELVKKSERRGEEVPGIGDRISFVIVRGNNLFSERAERVDYVIKNNLKVDSDYYIFNQILPPVLRLLKPFGVSEDHLIHNYVVRPGLRTKNVQKSILDF